MKTKKRGTLRARLIKGTMGTEGIMGLFPEIPAFPEIPEIPENSPKKAKPFKLKSVVHFAWINCLETAGTTETTERTERIFDTLFRCRLFRLCGLKKKPSQARDPISCQKGAECYTRRKRRRWVVLDVRPIVAFLLGAAIDPLSQEIQEIQEITSFRPYLHQHLQG